MAEANKLELNDSSEPRDSEKSACHQSTSTERLRALVAEYEAKLDEVAQLVARVRHEINNPLAGVLGQAQLLLREDLNDRARKRAETIEMLAIRLRDVVAQLRQIQKPAITARPESD